MSRVQANLLRGALELLILKAIEAEPQHGYGILEWIERRIGTQVLVEEGTLYPALHRLEERGWIAASWGRSDNNRRAKFYTLTPQGRRRLAEGAHVWHDFTAAVTRALETGG